jgi:hypothetical protein
MRAGDPTGDRMRGVDPAPLVLTLAALLLPGCATRPSDDHLESSALATMALGSYAHDTSGSLKEGDTSAVLVRLLGEANSEAGWGGGLSMEYLASDDDLLAGEGSLPTSATAREVSFHVLYRVSDGDRFRMPVRAGIFSQSLELTSGPGSDSSEWSTHGFRVAVAPEVVLARRRDFAFSLCSEVSLGFGPSRVDARTPPGDRNYSTSATMLGFDFGARFRFARFGIGISYVHRGTRMDDSDPKDGIFARGFDSSFDGVALVLDARF